MALKTFFHGWTALKIHLIYSIDGFAVQKLRKFYSLMFVI